MTELPLYAKLATWAIIASTSLCLLLVPFGVLRQKLTGDIPPVPQFPGSNFPHTFAYFYTAFFVLTFSLSSIMQIRMPLTRPEPEEMIVSALFQIALYVPFLWVYFTLPRRDVPATHLLAKAGWVCAALFILWFSAIILEISQFNKWLAESTNCPLVQDVVERMLNGSNFEKGLMVFMAVGVAPVTEECCFRGFIYNILKRWNARWVATLASAFLFAAVHGSLMQLLPLTIFGIIQCIAYEKARSLWLPIVIHTLFNACSSLFILLAPHLIPS